LVYAGNYHSNFSTEPYKIDVSPFVQVTAIWQGSTSSDWHTASNWSTNVVPNGQTVVSIPAGTVPCIISTANGEAKSVALAQGAVLELQNGKVLTIVQ
jgi:hypothetical protein